MFQKIEKYGTIRPLTAGNNANTERMKSLANLGKTVSNLAFDIGKKKRVKEGQIEGAKAGTKAAETGVAPEEKGSFIPRIFDDAFNDAQQGAYLASVDNQAITKLSELESQFGYDVEGYQKTSKGMLDGLVKNAPEAYRQPLTESINNYISRGSMRVNNNIVKRGQEETKSELESASKSYSDNAARFAQLGDYDQMEDMINKLELTTKARVSAGIISKEEGAETVMGARKEVFRQETKRDILDTGRSSYSKAVKMLDDFERKTPPNHTPDEHETNVDSIRADLRRLEPEKKKAKESGGWLKKATASIGAGFTLSSADKAEGASLVAGTDKQEDYERLVQADNFSRLPSSQRNAILGQLNDAGTLQAQTDFIAMNKIHQNVLQMAKDDGMALAERQGIVDPASIEGGDMVERNEQAEELSERYGVTVSPFKVSQIESLVESMADKTPLEKAELAMGLGGNEATYRQLDKKNASTFAMLSAQGDKDIAKAVFLGEELIKTKQFKLPPQADYMEDLNEYLGDAGEVYQVEDRATIIKAAQNYYATIGDEEYDSSSMEKALLAITGGIGVVNGRRVELPQGVEGDDLDDFFNEINPEILKQFGGLLYPHDIDDVRDGNLVSVGSGRYQLEIEGMRQYNRKHEPFEIEITPELIMGNEQLNQTPLDNTMAANAERYKKDQLRKAEAAKRRRAR